MQGIVECVPNFSEGRNAGTLSLLKQAAESVPGVNLLDIHTDADHNRSVFTLTGSPDALAEAAFLLAEIAVKHIDLTHHTGVHPRMGAVDVIPFVPIRGVTMEACVALAKRVGERIGRELCVPVFLYEKAAANTEALPERANLASIRRGGFEGMPEKIKCPQWFPDYGPSTVHPTAGVTAVGARKPLIAFNLHLDTPDVRIAQKIAKSVRGSSGGLPYCKAIGLYLTGQQKTQVSMNLTDYEQTPVWQAFEKVREEAERYGTRIISSELVGLIPVNAMADCAAYFLKMENYEEGKLL